MACAEHFERAFDRLVDVGALQGDAARPGERLHPLGRPFDAIERLGHQLHVFGQVRIVFHPLADPPQAVLHAVQRVGDLMGDAGHQLADAEHLLLLPNLGVGAIDVAADRGGEIDRHPQRAGKRRENAEHFDSVGRRQGRLRRKMQRVRRNPLQVQQQHHAADHRRGDRGDHVRRAAAQIHARDNHVKHEVEQERVSRQSGVVEQQRQRDQIEENLQEDVAIDVAGAGRDAALRRVEQQIVADHRQADEVQRPRVLDDRQFARTSARS